MTGKIFVVFFSAALAFADTACGDTNGCGCVKFNQAQDVSNLSLSFTDVEKMDAHAEQPLQDRGRAQRHHGHVRPCAGLAAELGCDVRFRPQERVRVPSERHADHLEVKS